MSGSAAARELPELPSPPAPAAPGPGVASLLWPKLRSAAPKDGMRSLLIRGSIAAPLGLGIAAATYIVASWFLSKVFAVELVGPLLVVRLFDMALIIFASLLVISNLITALSTFFLARDLELLVAAPVSLGRLFTVRFVESITVASWMVVLFGVPVLLAFGSASGGGAPFYLALAGAFIPFVIIFSALGALVCIALVRVFPARRVREIVAATAILGFAVLYVTFRFLEPERLLDPEGFASMVDLLRSLQTPSSPVYPGRWVSALMGAHVVSGTSEDISAPIFAAVRGRAPAWMYYAALWSTAGAAITLSSWAFRGAFPTAYTRAQEGREGGPLQRILKRLGRRRGAPTLDLARVFSFWLPAGLYRELWLKDIKAFLRDATQWSQLLLLGALVAVYLYNFRHFRALGEAGLIGPVGLYHLSVALAAFVVAAIAVRFVFPQISVEGSALWLLRTAPATSRSLLAAKTLAALGPLLLFGEGLVLTSSWILGSPPEMQLLAVFTIFLVVVAVVCLGMGLGSRFADFTAETAAKAATSLGGIAYMGASSTAALLIVGLMGYPAYRIYHFGFALPSGGRGALMVGLGVGALVLTGVTAWASLRIGAKALDRSMEG